MIENKFWERYANIQCEYCCQPPSGCECDKHLKRNVIIVGCVLLCVAAFLVWLLSSV